jgi:peptidoglycan/LPS O-acetylase OafA/YrhL
VSHDAKSCEKHANGGEPAFLSGMMAALVDFLRVASALTVFLTHTRLWKVNTIGPAPSALAAHYAVILFFVLSGVSIGTAARRPNVTLGSYALARATRILPVALFSVALGSLAYYLRHDASPIGLDAPWQELNWQAVVIPLLFLSEQPWGVTPVWNLPWWSLSYEVWYYALLGALVFLRGPRRIGIAVLLGILAGPQILALMPLWLMGVALAWFPQVVRVRPVVALQLLAGAGFFAALTAGIGMPALEWMQVHSPVPLINSQNIVGDHLFGAAAALALAGIRPFLPALAPMIEPFAPALRWMAGMSFTLYLFHGPLLNTMGSFGLVGLGNPVHSLAGMTGLLVACGLCAELCERRTPLLRRWIERKLAARSREPVGTLSPASTGRA